MTSTPMRFAWMAIALVAAAAGHSAMAIEPVIHADRSVTFRIQAPDATRVQIDVKGRTHEANGGRPLDMHQSADGIWTLTTEPLDPGFHYYFVYVNGFRCADTENPLYFGWQRPTNGIDIPDPDLDCYLPRPVARGEVRRRPYYSTLTESWREAYVYTPPGYDRDTSRKYPVLYLQHGAGENQTSWTNQGRAGVIVDNLLADGRCVPMIIVMDHGYATDPNMPQGQRNSENLFGRVVIEELIPMVESHYRVLSDREHRAIAGLSMGGGQAVAIGLAHLDKFASIGCFSGAVRSLDSPESGTVPDAAIVNRELQLLWIACGTEDRVIERCNAFHESLERRGIVHDFVTHPGTHEWQAWRRHLHDFAPRLFR